LIKAMPTAADGPVRKFGARVQNTGEHEYTPTAERVKHTIFPTGSSMNAAAAIPPAANAIAATKWYFRSIARSDLRPHQIIPTAPNAGGMIATNPVCMLVRPNPLTISGRKKPTPSVIEARQ
jgi:hypothetical protein